MWPFSSSSASSSSKSETVASDLTPPPGPSTQAAPPAPALGQATTQPSYGRLNIPSGNSAISPPPQVIDAEQDQLSGDKWADYKAAFEKISVKDDLSRIGETPCARSSLLYGIGGGSAIGAVRYLGSRSPKAGANWAVLGFVVIALTQWEVCTRARAKELAQMRLIQEKFPHRHVSTLKPPPPSPR